MFCLPFFNLFIFSGLAPWIMSVGGNSNGTAAPTVESYTRQQKQQQLVLPWNTVKNHSVQYWGAQKGNPDQEQQQQYRVGGTPPSLAVFTSQGAWSGLRTLGGKCGGGGRSDSAAGPLFPGPQE